MRRRALLLTTFSLCLVALLTGCSGDFANDGIASFEAGKYREAVDLLQVALSETEDPEVRFYLGVGLFRMGRPTQARSTLAPLLENEGFRQRALCQTVDIMISLGDSGPARSLLRDALDKTPADANLLEASVIVDAARVRDLRQKITDLLEAHLGEGRAPRVGKRIGLMLTATQQEFTQVFGEGMQHLSATYGFTDERNLKDLVVKSRSALRELQSTLRQTADADAGSFQSRIELAQIAQQRNDVDAVLETCGEIIAIQPESIAEAERRTRLRSTQIRAIELIRAVTESSERRREGIAILEAAVETFGQRTLDPHLARLYYLAGENGKLATLSQEWIKTEARNYWACFYRGWSLFTQEKYGDAIPYLVRAHGTRPNTPAFNLILGRAYEMTGELGQGLTYLRHAQELAPNDAPTVLDVARVYTKMGDEPEARRVLVSALQTRFRNRRSEDHVLILNTLVKMYRKVGAGITTLVQARNLLERDPDNPYVGIRVAQLESERGSWDNAIKVLRRVQSRLPDLADAWRVGARLALDHKKWSHVHRQLRGLKEVEPSDPLIPWMRASAYLAQRRYEDASKEARTALEENPTEIGVRLVLIDIEMAQRNWTSAITIARNALKVLPDDDDVQLRMAKALMGAEQWKESAAMLRRLEAQHGEDAEFLYLLGRALVKSGEAKAAIGVIARAVKAVDKEDYSRRITLGRTFYDAKSYSRSARVFSNVYRDLPRGSKLSVTTLQLLARSHHRAKNYLGACDALVLLRRLDYREAAYNLFMQLASTSAAHHEVASVFDLADAESRLTQTGLEAALKSQLAAAAWKGAENAILLLGQIDDGAKPRLLLETARIQLGRGQRTRGLATLRRAINAGPGTDRVAVYTAWLRFLVADNDPKAALDLLDEAVAAAPSNGLLKLIGGEAALMLGDVTRAGLLLGEAVQLSPRDQRARLLLAICHAARGSYPEALKALARPQNRTQRQVLAFLQALAGDKRPSGAPSLAQFIWHLRSGECKQAAQVATHMSDVPRVWRASLAALAEHLQTRAEKAPLAAEVLGRAAAFSTVGVLQKTCMKELSAARATQVEESAWIDLYAAWTLIRYGAAKAAVTAMAPRIVAGIEDPLVVYLTGVGTMGNTSAKNIEVLINGHLGKGPINSLLARDLRDAATEMDAHEVALALSSRIAKPTDEDLAVKTRILYRLGRPEDAGKTAAGISDSAREADPFLRLITSYRALVAKEPGARQAMRALLEDTTPFGQLDPVLVVNALVRAGMADKISQTLRPLLETKPYDAYTFHRLALAVGKSQANRHLYDRLMAAVSLVDPRGALRETRREDRPLAQW